MDSPLLTASALLLATAYGTFQLELKVVEILNGLRDRVLERAEDETTSSSEQLREHLKLLIYSDWVGVWVPNQIFLIVLSIIIWNVPDFLPVGLAPDAIHKMTILAKTIGTLPAFGAFWWLVAGFFDFRSMRSAIARIDSMLMIKSSTNQEQNQLHE